MISIERSHISLIELINMKMLVNSEYFLKRERDAQAYINISRTKYKTFSSKKDPVILLFIFACNMFSHIAEKCIAYILYKNRNGCAKTSRNNFSKYNYVRVHKTIYTLLLI
jgi:uncharacterized membrane protein YukC